jgi:carboxylesterase type B
MSSAILYHPVLGPLQGYFNSSQKVTEYRNIKYASIPARFYDPISMSYPPVSSSNDVSDCIKFGPSCPQHPSGFTYDVALVGEVQEMHVEMDRRRNSLSSSRRSDIEESDCLNLIVTIPEGSLDELLPVMVWYVRPKVSGHSKC